MQFSDTELKLMRDVFHNQDTDAQQRSNVAKRLSDYFNLSNEAAREKALWDRYYCIESGDALNWIWERLCAEHRLPNDFEKMCTSDVLQDAIDNGDLSLDSFEEFLEEATKTDPEELRRRRR